GAGCGGSRGGGLRAAGGAKGRPDKPGSGSDPGGPVVDAEALETRARVTANVGCGDDDVVDTVRERSSVERRLRQPEEEAAGLEVRVVPTETAHVRKRPAP